MQVTLKGIHKVKSKGSTYYYAWRGGPPLRDETTGKFYEPGTPAFLKAYNAAIEELRTPDNDRFRSLVVKYKASKAFTDLASVTKLGWGRWLDKITEHFGDLRIKAFDHPNMKLAIRQWRGKWADTPRYADQGLTVLSVVLTYAIDPLGRLSVNACDGIKRLYTANDRSEIIWTDDHVARAKAATNVQTGWAIDLAGHSGLRESDLVALAWSHIGEYAIELPTSKSRGKRVAIVPLYDELRAVLAGIPKIATTVLTNTERLPWNVAALGKSITRAKQAAKIEDDIHFHDLRGTAATKFYTADIPIRVIAEICGWEERTVDKIIRKYVGRQAATQALIAQLNERRTNAVKQAVKLDGQS
ncbi:MULTISPECIES: tyrosine-type recombinase/integrase [unclassified Bradyrhizobium]|uniref:site-specific integrase n=1 Tax=unclassified Bradyrhizobium TaxID=2631580 RepID=UPI00339A2852